MRRLPAAILVVGLLAVFAASCASHHAEQYDKRVARAMAALISAGDADSLAAAGLLGNWLKDGEARRLELMARASEEAPGRPDLAWLHLQSCTQVKSCDPESIARRLRALDPIFQRYSVVLERIARATR